jgi:hypothetical protein
MANLNKLQSEARAAFRTTKLGKVLTETKKSIDSGTANVKSIMAAGSNIQKMTGQQVTRDLMQQMGLGNAWQMIERYAGKDAWRQILGHLKGPAKILEALSKKGQAQQISVPELEVAINLVKAFGYGITEPGSKVSLAPQQPDFSQLKPEVQQKIIEQEQRQARILGRLPGWPARQQPQQPLEQQIMPQRVTEEMEPFVNMQTEMILVSSSNVHSIGFRYDTREIGTLLVRYLATTPDGHRAGPGSLYEYFKVPSLLFERFKQAASKGKFVWDNLRIRGTKSGHKFTYDLTGITQNYVPRRAQLIYFRGPRGGLRASEAYVPRTFNQGEIRRGRLQMRQLRSQLPQQMIGKSFSVRRR